jgi:hypothetical protein
MSTLHTCMINLALKSGNSFCCWKKVVDIMLEKEPGSPKTHRLQVIHLYEADYNLILALQAWKVVHHSKDKRLFNDSLYRAQPGPTAHDPVGVEEIVGEITRLSRKPCIKMPKMLRHVTIGLFQELVILRAVATVCIDLPPLSKVIRWRTYNII